MLATSEKDILRWFGSAKGGDRFVYHSGTSTLPHIADISAGIKKVRSLYNKGLVELVQRRLTPEIVNEDKEIIPGTFEYLVVKRSVYKKVKEAVSIEGNYIHLFRHV